MTLECLQKERCHDLHGLGSLKRSTTSWRVEIDAKRFFRDGRHRSKFLGDRAEGAERYRVKVHCYVLMENHIHVVATPPGGQPFKVDASIEDRVHVYFNRRHPVVGHLFHGRFKSTVIETENYLLEVS
jgi:putative transposase